MTTISALQMIFGILVLASALTVVFAKNPVISAIMLMSTLFLTGGLYMGMGLFFIGAVQILIYAGAIAVLFVFIVMLLDLKPFFLRIPGRGAIAALAVIATGLLAAGLLLMVLPQANLQQGLGLGAQIDVLQAAQPKTISLQILSKYMIPFQMAGLLILAAVMGAVVLGRPKKPSAHFNDDSNTQGVKS